MKRIPNVTILKGRGTKKAYLVQYQGVAVFCPKYGVIKVLPDHSILARDWLEDVLDHNREFNPVAI